MPNTRTLSASASTTWTRFVASIAAVVGSPETRAGFVDAAEEKLFTRGPLLRERWLHEQARRSDPSQVVGD